MYGFELLKLRKVFLRSYCITGLVLIELLLKSSPVHFWLRTDTNKKDTFAVHANRMKPFIDPDLRPIDTPLFDDPNKPYQDGSDILEDCFENCEPLATNAHPGQGNPGGPTATQPESQPEEISVDNQSIFSAEKF